MKSRISRRDFLGLSLVGVLSACTARALSTPEPTATMRKPTDTSTHPPTSTVPLPTATQPQPTATFDPSPHTHAADDANIFYSGRIDFSDPKRPVFSAPGVVVKAAFHGTGAAVLLEDEFLYGFGRNYYDAVIDGTTVVKIAPEHAVTRYEVAVDLPEADHTLELVKRTEASVGKCTFLGFEFSGSILPAPPAPTRRLEFIGDSITCGAGIEGVIHSDACLADGWGQPTNNARLTYAADIARAYNAEYHLSSVSGIGLVRNYSFKYDARPMPDVYDELFFEQIGSARWDPALYVPDALVIALGTNDFSPGDSDRPMMAVAEFADAYVSFIKKLRAYFPQAHIFCVSSPMLGDGWPAGYHSLSDQKASITQVVDGFNSADDDRVHKYFMPSLVNMGCASHPDVSQHQQLADVLGPVIAATLGWA